MTERYASPPRRIDAVISLLSRLSRLYAGSDLVVLGKTQKSAKMEGCARILEALDKGLIRPMPKDVTEQVSRRSTSFLYHRLDLKNTWSTLCS